MKDEEFITDGSGTPTYMAPEVLSEKPYDPYAADIWSLGILLFTFLNGWPPFKDKDKTNLKNSILSGEYKFKRELSEDAKDMCDKLIQVNPQKRMSIEQ